jgi:TolB-like protein
LVAYLALVPRGQSRSQLCELLWDAPSDPRGELRWCLSKIRSLVDSPGSRRVHTREDTVSLDLADCFVDVAEVERAWAVGIDALPPERLRALEAHFAGDLLEGLDIDRSPAFEAWLTAQRRRFRACHAALLQRLAAAAIGDEVFGHLDKWLQLAPFDIDAHGLLLAALARRGRIREGEEHLAVTARQFDAEGLDVGPLHHAWRVARSPVVAVVDERPGEPAAAPSRRASLAVMPFADAEGDRSVGGGLADALAHDIITRLAKLRSMFVIAQGTVFALHERGIGPEEAGRMLGVDYGVSGSTRRQQGRVTVTVELSETRSARIVWAEVFSLRDTDAFLVLDEIGDRIVASIASEIETIERNRAILKPPNSLDAWESLHRGLWHMYRFSRGDNEQARRFFESAVRQDPTFARAYAGLSFTHFQNVFQGWAVDREPEIALAFDAAGHGLMADDRDPSAHWAMGRALWLRHSHEESIAELEQAIDLSPNFALGHYTLAFVRSQVGDPLAAIWSADHSRRLSPFDPLLFGMFGSRAMAHVRLREFEQAAEWAVKAAARPNAHPHIVAIAAFSLALAGDLDKARAHGELARKGVPHYSVENFLQAFRFDAEGEALFCEGAKRIGMS